MFYWQDIKYALRLLAKSPFFTILTVVVLAGGLGLSIFTFSFLHTAMLKPLPVPEGERVVRLLATGGASSSGLIDAADLAGIRADVTVLTDVGAYAGREVVVGTGQGSRAIQATATEWNVFRATRATPALGRGFRPDDQVAGAEPVVVLSHWAWRVVFGADSGLIGQHVPLNGVSTRIIGVMPEGYGFPVAAEAWVPIRPELLAGNRAEPGLGRSVRPAGAGRRRREGNHRAHRPCPARPEFPRATHTLRRRTHGPDGQLIPDGPDRRGSTAGAGGAQHSGRLDSASRLRQRHQSPAGQGQ